MTRARGASARAAAIAVAALAGCAPAPLGEPPRPYEVEVPPGFPPMPAPEEGNPTTVEGVALGRRLYYDRRLSADGSRACADCHHQARGFSSDRATGVLPHVNLAWSRNFLWDGHVAGSLEDVMRFEVEDFFHTDVERLREPELEAMFAAAFGSPEPTTERAALALAQFQRTLVSGASRYDAYVGGDEAALSEAERRGMGLFFSERGDCFHCHATSLFTDNLFHNVGLDAEVAGTGRGAITGRALDDGLYKTPTLRNVEVTGPYMHDDRFATLEAVVDHYSDGLVWSDTIDSLLPNVRGGGLDLSPEERADLVAFLRTLTDEGYLADPALGPPPGE